MKNFAVIPAVLSLGLHARVALGEDIAIDWKIEEYSDKTAVVGDTVIFNWENFHNVYIHPSGDCDTADAILVGEESPAKHRFTEAGKITFACDVGGHCGAGQIVTFEVAESDSAGTGLLDQIADAAEDVIETVGDAVGAVGDKIEAFFNDTDADAAKDKVEDKVDEAKEKVEAKVDEAKEKGEAETTGTTATAAQEATTAVTTAATTAATTAPDTDSGAVATGWVAAAVPAAAAALAVLFA